MAVERIAANIPSSSLNWTTILSIAVSALAIVNGLMLLKYYLRDKPIIEVNAIYPDTYQWFFRLPNGVKDGLPTRKYGYLTYIDIKNKGIRDVSLDDWQLVIRTAVGKSITLSPISIPEPQTKLGKTQNLKVWAVLGQDGQYFKGNTLIKSGDSICGFAYYFVELYGSNHWNPIIKNGKTSGLIKVRSVFGNKAITKISFSEISLTKAVEFIPDIDKIY